MKHRKAIFAFGASRSMNTYLYAPKDDPTTASAGACLTRAKSGGSCSS
jgi:hypothetical protein